MASFSIKNLLADDQHKDVPIRDSPPTSPGSTPPLPATTARTPPSFSSTNTTPDHGHNKTPSNQQPLQEPYSDVLEVSVLNSGVAGRSSRKRCRDGGSLGSTSESEGFQSDTGSLSPSLSGSSPPDGSNKSKRLRTAFSTSQLRSLEHYFRICPYPDNMGRDVISRVTGIDESKIQVWFQNRRARYRKREKALQPPTPSVHPSPLPAVLPPQILTAPQATHPHTIPTPKVSHPCTTTTPQPSQTHSFTAPQGTHPHHYASALLHAYYTTLAYQAYCAQSLGASGMVPPTFPHLTPHAGHPYHLPTPSTSTQPTRETSPDQHSSTSKTPESN